MANYLDSLFEMRYIPPSRKNIPIICNMVRDSPRIPYPKMAAKNGVVNSIPETCAALRRFRPS